jgi:hypothetical protein
MASRRRFLASSLLASTALVGWVLGGSPQRRAQADDPLGALLSRVGRARSTVRTLQGPFVQTRTIGLLATDVRSRGSLALVRPDRLRWELEPPDDVVFFLGPDGLAYRSAHGQGRAPAASGRMGAALDDLRTVLGGDLTRLRQRWELRLLRDDATGAEIEAVARPGTNAPLASLRFALGPDLVRPTRVVLVEGPHDKTVVDFGSLVVDAPVDPARLKP